MFSQTYASSDAGSRCGICGCRLHLSYPCAQSHPEHCHDCAAKNLASGFDAREHPPPPEPETLVLSPRDVQALVAYQARMARLREED